MTASVRKNQPAARAAGMVLRLAIYCWIGKAVYLWASSDFYPGSGVWARTYLAGRDALHTFPETVLYLFQQCGLALEWVYASLSADLGYDPFAQVMPDVTAPSLPGWADLQTVTPGDVSGLAAYAVEAGAGVSIGQAVILFGIMLSGGGVSWRAPGLPVVVDVRAKVVFSLLSLGIAGALAYAAFQVSLVAGIAVAAIVVVCVRLPLIAGLPLWVLDRILGLHPRLIATLPMALLTGIAGLVLPFRNRRHEDRSHGHANGWKWQKTWHRESSSGTEGTRQQERPRESSTPGLGQSHEVDCALFNLEPDSFDRATLTKRYRERMKMLHPDHDGDEAATKRLNAAYERILEHHGWRR